MNAGQILNRVLLKKQQITLSFTSPQALQSFRSALHTYLSRYRKQMSDLGDTSFDDLGIQVTGTYESATFSLASKSARKKHNYQILDITSCENMSQSGKS